MNIYINYILYVGAIFSLLLYIIGRYKNKFSKKYFSLLLGILFTYIVGTLIGFLKGISLNNSQEFIYNDLLKSAVFPLTLVFAGIMSKVRNIKYTKKIILLLGFMFSVIIFINKFLGIIAPGNLIKASTVQLYNLSFVGFFGLYLLSKKYHKNIARFIILLSWLTALLSLAKWNFIPVIIFPFLWIIIETKKINIKKRLIFCFVILIIFASLIFNLRNNIVEFASNGHYNSFNSYWRSRVITENSLKNEEIRTGGRIKIWSDLLQQFSKSPISGVGLGARPTFLNVEDHNMFIFFLVRFGILLFSIMMIFLLILILHILRCPTVNKTNRLILFTLFLYFFFSASIGSCFGQIINGLTIGGIVGIIINPRNADILIKNKNDKLNKKNIIHPTR